MTGATMTRDDDRQLELMIEVIARAIPKERDAAKLYRDTAQHARQEMARMLFEKLAAQEEEHEQKLRSAMEILRRELVQSKAHPEQPHPEGASCQSQEFNVNIRRTLRVATELKDLSEKGLGDANDPSCRAMYEKMAEMSLTLRELAGEEVEKHVDKEKWD
jgi:rubrerythrin